MNWQQLSMSFLKKCDTKTPEMSQHQNWFISFNWSVMENSRVVFVLLKLRGKPDFVEFSHFYIEIAYSNFTFCGSSTPSFCEFSWNPSKFQQNEQNAVIENSRYKLWILNAEPCPQPTTDNR